MNSKRFLIGLLKILGQISTMINLLTSAAVIYSVLSGASSMSGATSVAWMVVGAIGVTTGLWAIIGTAYYERFAESSRLAKLMALASATAGALMIVWFIASRPQ
ncbi:MAG: hypothetical protein KatS3mg053_0261 [Candidatus Roseilinea sp.]|nr:MAG: hypothetical protein KatS3mg053_0261 [Candidatus Roseilinea sp.]